ncbi:MAG: type II toxin-antitoxin system RelE/ParE family toxin [Gammaproteobacteria bacterium]|nr:MAG: type II toxin-antitoxin system RelE/ParE family toxin [Gammaproteobacteria bacterium]
MKYEIEIERSALKALQKIPAMDRDKIIDAIEHLAFEPRPVGAKKLSGRDGWRIRIGNYRVIYEIIDHTCYILVLDIGHRKDIYR